MGVQYNFSEITYLICNIFLNCWRFYFNLYFVLLLEDCNTVLF